TIREMGLDIKEFKLKAGTFGAELWSENMRARIEDLLDIDALDIYGLTEISGPGVAFECSEQSGMHINEDHFIPEIIDPETGEVLPEGEIGELVFTAIDKEAFPMLRYRTRDLCKLTREKCGCGRTLIKMCKPMGRSDDMMIIRGVNVFPSQIETVLIEQGYTPNYLIEVDRKNNTDTLDISVELTAEQFSDKMKDVQDRERSLAAAIKTMLGISPKVHLVSPKTITRSEGKAVRVIDRRKLHD
ncbi:MAG: phenylacetate--CoA ligase, partial [Oscillospiraceae bacterium]|nr:phenylacetate--CoA ligase [Oscillospiraceae bacterium]